jgi:integrase
MDPLTGKRPATREVSVGIPATHSPEQARAAANKVKGEAKAGADPARDRRAAIAKAAKERAATVDRLLEDYVTALPHRPKMRGAGTLSPRALQEEIRNVRLAVATMKVGERIILDVAEADIRILLTKEAKRPATARYRFGALSRFLDWCRDEGLIVQNPCLAIGKNRRPRPAKARTHHLPLSDLATLWHATPLHRLIPTRLISVPYIRTMFGFSWRCQRVAWKLHAWNGSTSTSRRVPGRCPVS